MTGDKHDRVAVLRSVTLPLVGWRWLAALLALIALVSSLFSGIAHRDADDFCDRMMTGSDKAHWEGAPWVKDDLLSEINSASRQMCYTFGYTFGYLCEQVAIGALSGGTVKVAQVAVKGGVHLTTNLAKRTAGALGGAGALAQAHVGRGREAAR